MTKTRNHARLAGWRGSMLCGLVAACDPATSGSDSAATTTTTTLDPGLGETLSSEAGDTSSTPAFAEVLAVESSGESGAYTFSVTLRSPDLGCEQYANWWEVLNEAGELLYRRILAHSHVQEQPFTRSGGPVEISPDDHVIVRAHMDPGGYGPQVMEGSVAAGFAARPRPDFAPTLENQPPQPGQCPN